MGTWLGGGASGGLAGALNFEDRSEGFQATLAFAEPESLAFPEPESVLLLNRNRWRF